MFVAVFSFLIWQRSGRTVPAAVAEILRLLIIGIVVLTLNQPEWRETHLPDYKPTVLILHDDSGSMATEDVAPQADDKTPRSRSQAAKPLINPALWSSLDDAYSVSIESFSTPTEDGTDIAAALTAPLETQSHLAAVVLISDGDWNRGEAPVDVARRYRASRVPIFTLPLGSETHLPDLALTAFSPPTFALVGKSVALPYTLESQLPQDQETILELRSGDQKLLGQGVKITAMGRVEGTLLWMPQAEGDLPLTLTAHPVPEERDQANNTLGARISIRKEALKVLVIESYPRWEYRYLRNALERDPGVEVHCLLFHPDGSGPGRGPGYLDAFPPADELASYDVVFLGDVGIENRQLTNDQATRLKGVVSSQATGLVFLPGFRGYENSLLDSDLKDLFPVTLDTAQPRGWGARSPSRLDLTELGTKSLLTRLEDGDAENSRVWATLPGFHWHSSVLRSNAGSEVLATHSTESNRYGRIPLIVTKTYGAGKILFMGTDGAWRWRRGVEDKYHYRFWGQVVRWMAYQRNMASGSLMRLFYSPDRPRVGDTLSLNANAMSIGGEPLQTGRVSIRILTPSGRVDTVQLRPAGEGQWGLFSATFSPTEPGDHKLTLSCVENGETLDAVVSVQGMPREQVGKPARPEVLAELARISRGEQLTTLDPSALLDHIQKLPPPAVIETRLRLWAHPAWIGVVVLLLTAFWIVRKRAGAV